MSDYMRRVLCFSASTLAKALRGAVPTPEDGLSGWNTTAGWLWEPGNYEKWADFSAQAEPLRDIQNAAKNIWFVTNTTTKGAKAPTGARSSGIAADGLWPWGQPQDVVGAVNLVQLHWQLASNNAQAFESATSALCNTRSSGLAGGATAPKGAKAPRSNGAHKQPKKRRGHG